MADGPPQTDESQALCMVRVPTFGKQESTKLVPPLNFNLHFFDVENCLLLFISTIFPQLNVNILC